MQFFKSSEDKSSFNLSSEIAKLKESFHSRINRLESALNQEEVSTSSATQRVEEIEKSLKGVVATLKDRLREKEELLETRNVELKDLRSKMDILANRATQMESTIKEAETSVTSESRRAEEIESGLKEEINTLEGRLKEKEKLLGVRDTELRGFKRQMSSNTNGGENVVIDELESKLVENESLLDAKEKEIEKVREQMAAENEKLRSELQAKKVLLAKIERDEWKAIGSSKMWKGWTGS